MRECFETTGVADDGYRSVRVNPLVALVLGLFVLAAPAWAEPPPTFELSVVRLEGAGSCPSGTAFERRVAARLGRIPFTEPAERTIETLLSRKEDAWRAEITLRDATGIVQGRREIEAVGADCEPLAEATALALALAIDPDAALGSPATVPELQPVAPPQLSPPPCPPPRRPACPSCSRAVCPPVPGGPYIAASVRAVLALGLIPGPAPGVALNAEAGSHTVRGHAGLIYLPETFADDPRFAFGLTTAAAGACALLRSRGSFDLGFCGEIQLGAIHAVVRDALPIDPGDEPWVAAALGPRLRVDVSLPVVIDVGMSAVVPFVARSFDLRGAEEPAFEPATVGAVGFIGVGMRTP